MTESEVMAIVMYTYDITTMGPQHENFYFQLNEILRRRNVNLLSFSFLFFSFLFFNSKTKQNKTQTQTQTHKHTQAEEMEAIKGYLYYALSALRKLPNFTGVVFRGK